MTITPDEMRAMAERLDGLYRIASALRFRSDTANDAAAMLRSIAAEREEEFFCGRCGKRFDAPKTEEIDW